MTLDPTETSIKKLIKTLCYIPTESCYCSVDVVKCGPTSGIMYLKSCKTPSKPNTLPHE